MITTELQVPDMNMHIQTVEGFYMFAGTPPSPNLGQRKITMFDHSRQINNFFIISGKEGFQ